MKKLIINAAALAFFATSLFTTSMAHAAEVTLPVSISQVGKMKFLVSAESESKLTVIIYDVDQNVILKDAFTNQKLYNFTHLSDGKYKLEIVNTNKQVVQSKTFSIQTEVKRDLVAVQ
jgi:hypothetical protein